MTHIAENQQIVDLKQTSVYASVIATAVNVTNLGLTTGMVVSVKDLLISGDNLGGDFKVVDAGTYTTADGYYVLNDASSTKQLVRIVDLNSPRIVLTPADINSVNAPDNQRIEFKGRMSAYDGGGGTGYITSSPAFSADGGAVISLTGGKYLVREGLTSAGFVGELPVQAWYTSTSNDWTAAFNSAASFSQLTGAEITVGYRSTGYRVTGSITATGARFRRVGKKCPIYLDSALTSRLFNLSSAIGTELYGLQINGNKATTPAGEVIYMAGATECVLSGLELYDCPSGNGAVTLRDGATKNKVIDCSFSSGDGNCIGLLTADVIGNIISKNVIYNNTGFGIYLSRASNNQIEGNYTVKNGIELIGLAVGSNHNRIIGNHAQGCGDNGISVTGDHNLVSGNVCKYNKLSGIFLYGSFNTASANICVGNNQAILTNSASTGAGIAIQAVFGGAGQYNSVFANTLDDDQTTMTQTQGLRVMSMAYTAWTSGETVAINAYRYNGLNIYRSTTAGICGATAPTHTTGTVSDGVVSWIYLNTALVQCQTAYNIIGKQLYGRSVVGDYLYQQVALNSNVELPDTTNLGSNELDSYTFRMRAKAAGLLHILFNGGGDNGSIDYDLTAGTMALTANTTTPLTLARNAVLTAGQFVFNSVAVTGATYTCGEVDTVIACQTNSLAKSITLPTTGRRAGRVMMIFDEAGIASTYNITLIGSSTNTIEGSTSYTINTNYGGVIIMFTPGGKWKIISKF